MEILYDRLTSAQFDFGPRLKKGCRPVTYSFPWQLRSAYSDALICIEYLDLWHKCKLTYNAERCSHNITIQYNNIVVRLYLPHACHTDETVESLRGYFAVTYRPIHPITSPVRGVEYLSRGSVSYAVISFPGRCFASWAVQVGLHSGKLRRR